MRQNPSEMEFKIDLDKPKKSTMQTRRTRKRRIRWNLMTLLLMMPVVATWTQYFRLRHENGRLQREIQEMESRSRKLIVEQTDRLAVVKLPPSWVDEKKWEIVLPSEESVTRGGATYQLCLATREITLSGARLPIKTYTLPAGRHQIELILRHERVDGKQSEWSIAALLDDNPVIEINESADWNPGFGGWGIGGDRFDQPYQPNTIDESVYLFQEQFSVDQSSRQIGPSEATTTGLLLWVQPLLEKERQAIQSNE